MPDYMTMETAAKSEQVKQVEQVEQTEQEDEVDSDADCDAAETKDKSNTSDLYQLVGSLWNAANFKLAIIMLLIGVIIFSDSFVDGCLSRFSHTTTGTVVNSKGTFIQLGLYSVSLLLVEMMVKSKII